MIKRKAAYALVGGLIVTGLVFNAPTMATYVQNLGTATQTINAATWNIEFGNDLGTHTIFPGQDVSNDTITLTNNNNYPVKYTIKLSSTDKGLKEALTLDVKDDQGNSYGNNETTGEITVGEGATIKLNSHVTWTSSDEENKDISYQGKSVQYHYDIKAEKAKEDETTPEVSPILEKVEGYRSSRTQQIFTSFKINESLNLAPFSKDNVRIIYLDENGNAISSLTKDKTWGGFLNNNTTKFPKGLENNSEYSNNLEPGTYTSTTKQSDTDKYKDVKSVKVVVIKDGVEYSSKFEL